VTRRLFEAPDGPATLEGVLERVTWSDEESAWSVVRLHVQGRADPVTAVGNLLGVQPGESLRLTGRWVHDRKYGEQFKVESYLTVRPSTLIGVQRYLGSGLVPGIGPVMAERLVRAFGIETLEIIDSAPDRLAEVEGIGPVRSARIREAWAEQRGIRDVMVFLQSHGVSTGYAVKIYRQYQGRAIGIVREDPYRLASEVFGIGFKSADRIAESLGIPKDSPRRAQAGVLHVLGALAEEGHVYCPGPELVRRTAELLEIAEEPVSTALDAEARDGRIVIEPGEEPAVYLRALHGAEAGSAALLGAILRAPVRPLEIDIERALAWFEERSGLVLADEQRRAVRQAISSRILVVTGGPGTGKTTLVQAVIRILERKGRRILLAAPTGRAAKRMQETTGRAARTIHRMLEFNPRTGEFQRNPAAPLEADLVIVDEASMLDIVLAHHLLRALPPPCQLMMVGDVDQLPSVGPGAVLADLIRSGAVGVVRLTEIFRQAAESRIVVNAHRINRGEMPALEAADAKSDFFFVEREEPEEILSALRVLVRERIPRRFGLDPVEDVQVLTPMHRGLLGAASLNAELQALLNPAGDALSRGARVFRVRDRVMQVRNNYELDVFNGDIGRVEAIDDAERQVRVRFEDRVVAYEYADLDELVLAYAVSIHKSQGSEYPCVVVPLHTQHYVMLQRNLLYTALTRAKRLAVIVGTRRALGRAVRNAEAVRRYTHLAERLRGLNGLPPVK